MSNDAPLIEPDPDELATLYQDYLCERDLSMYAAESRALPEFYAPVPTPLTLVVCH